MIIKIISSLIVFALTSIVAYLFKVRQLYAVVPKLYRNSILSEEGTVSEVIIYNKGNKTEEDIILEIEQDVKCELLASSSSEIKFINNTIQIPRLHIQNEASLILLIENGTLTHEKILSISSKECKGEVHKSIEEVPPSARSFAIGIIAIILVIIAFSWLPTIIDYTNKKWLSYNYPQLEKNGWTNIENYLSSDLQDSYSDKEFPIRFLEYKLNGKLVEVTYEVINKSALPITVTIREKEHSYKGWYQNYIHDKSIPTLSKDKITISALRTEIGLINIEFNIKFSDDNIYNLEHTIKIEPYTKLTNKTLTKKILGSWTLDDTVPLSSIITYKEDNTFQLKSWIDTTHKKLFSTLNGKWFIEDNKLTYSDSNFKSPIKYKEKISKVLRRIIQSNTIIVNITDKKMIFSPEKNLFKESLRIDSLSDTPSIKKSDNKEKSQ